MSRSRRSRHCRISLCLASAFHVVLRSVENLPCLLGPGEHPLSFCRFFRRIIFSPGSGVLQASHPHFRHGYYAAWETGTIGRSTTGRRERCSPSLQMLAQNTLRQFSMRPAFASVSPANNQKRCAVGNACPRCEPHKPRERQAGRVN